ncbi:hypothetical protein GWK47_018706 [Chionoecetes opilio]|uniref:RNA-directed DNA polymerase n=1 Tax=Chionoecetes opilio TaxID=41210 RepID=A0A8J5CIH9_CHIOP|nr:hypothetical protein GWK47_018706 [Chionoecetes opilio]
MLLRLLEYDVTVRYKPGRMMLASDALSRLPADRGVPVPMNMEVRVDLLHFSPERLEELRRATASDEVLSLVRRIIVDGWPDRRCQLNPQIRDYWSVRDSLVIDDGVILKGNAAVIPKLLRAWYIDKLHDGHQGRVKMELRAKDAVYWPGMRNDIESKVNACQPCQFTRPANDCMELTPDHQHPVPQGPWQDVSTDLFYYNSHNYILVVDHYSSYVFVYKLTGTTSRDVIEILMQLFAEHGSPTTLYSDNGPQFDSREFANFAARFEFRHTTSSPLHPQSNGIAERQVRIVKDLLKRSNGNDAFYRGLRSLRSTPLDAHLPSPAEMLLGRKVDTLPRRACGGQPNHREQLERRREQQRLNFNARFQRHTPVRAFDVGDPVLVRNARANEWQPATVVDKHHTPASYIVQPKPAREVNPPETSDGETATENRMHTPPAWRREAMPLRRTAQMIRPDPVRTRSGRISRPPERLQY